MELDESRRARSAGEGQLRELISSLTRKERDVLQFIGLGQSMKGIACQLDLNVRAIEQRRRGLMAKLRLHSPLELVRFSISVNQLNGFPKGSAPGAADRS